MASSNSTLDLTFGILGNIISTGVYLAPLPTFYQIYKRKSTQGFQSVPYLVALFSSSLWLYYALLLHKDAVLLITINSVGCLIESIYIILYIVYATTGAEDLTVKILVTVNAGVFSLITLLTYYLVHGDLRIKIVGWICSAISVCVFVAPLGIVRQVIRTRSVEFMPFTLSAFLTISAIIWFFYGLFKNDYFIAAPNILGFIFGILQMVLYGIYRKSNAIKKEKLTLPVTVINTVAIRTPEVHPVDVQPPNNARTEIEVDANESAKNVTRSNIHKIQE